MKFKPYLAVAALLASAGIESHPTYHRTEPSPVSGSPVRELARHIYKYNERHQSHTTKYGTLKNRVLDSDDFRFEVELSNGNVAFFAGAGPARDIRIAKLEYFPEGENGRGPGSYLSTYHGYSDGTYFCSGPVPLPNTTNITIDSLLDMKVPSETGQRCELKFSDAARKFIAAIKEAR